MQKITLTTETRRCINPNPFLGYEGENNANKLTFEFTDGFIDGLAVLKVERGETKGTIDLVKGEQTYELEVKSSLLAVEGDIKFQFVITQPNGIIIKYDPFIMTVKDAIDADAELPEEYPSWQEIIATELAKVEKATENANKVAEDLIRAKENGEFDGNDYVLTDKDKKEISSLVVPIVEEDIQPTIQEIKEISERAETIAKGRATGYVFDTIEDLELWVQDVENTNKLILGDNLYIREVGVPDYWWDGKEKQVLETQKVDLTEYVQNKELPNKVINIVGDHVTLTQAQYDALETKDINTYYYIEEE